MTNIKPVYAVAQDQLYEYRWAQYVATCGYVPVADPLCLSLCTAATGVVGGGDGREGDHRKTRSMVYI